MSYQPEIVQAATKRLDEHRRMRQHDAETLQNRAYAQNPRVKEIDRLLRDTMMKIMGCTLRPDPNIRLEDVRAESLSLQEERSALLLGMNIDPNRMGLLYSCPTCQDSGWIGKTMCDCLGEFCIQEQITQLDALLQGTRQSFAQFNLDYYSRDPWAGCPSSPYETMEIILQFCLLYTEKFQESKIKNLLFSGSPGLGKTFLSACIARAVSERGFSVEYGTIEVILQAFETKQYRKFDQEEYGQALAETKAFLSCDLLVVDDLGTESSNAVKHSAFYELINTRLLHGRHTIISTNLSMDELSHRYPPQVVSRLDGEYRSFQFFGKDIRKEKKNRF